MSMTAAYTSKKRNVFAASIFALPIISTTPTTKAMEEPLIKSIKLLNKYNNFHRKQALESIIKTMQILKG